MNTHPAAELFPLMEGADFVKLCQDIRENGLRLAIIKHPDGSILDGRNRLRACEEMRIKPTFVEWTGKVGTEIDFVLSHNLNRRHLDVSQRAMVAAKVADMRQGERTDLRSRDLKSQPEAAKEFKVSVPTVKRAKVVLEEGSKAQIKAVESGEKTVTEVVREIRPPKPQPEKPKETGELDRLKAENAKLLRSAAARDKELSLYSESLEADDKTAPLLKEIKKLNERIRILEERNVGLQAEKAEAVRASESWRRKAEKK